MNFRVIILALAGYDIASRSVMVVVEGCSTVLVGKDASADGMVIASHSDDGEGRNDPRIMYVPPNPDINTHQVPVFPDLGYPRYVGYDRGPDYYPTSKSSPSCCTQPIGHVHIPDKYISNNHNKTFGYLDGNYGILNDAGLQVGGESTCSAVFTSIAIGKENGTALFSINELGRMALQFTSTARDAIALMGYLAETHGFYGPANNDEGSGESLMVADRNEGFVFHILPDDTGTSAIYIAQRVPDNHVTVVANMFTIRHVNLTDTHNFMGSQYMDTVAQRQGIWLPNTPFDFTKVFSNGEYAHKYYSGRRMWGFFHQMAPSLHLQANYEHDLRLQAAYPWSVEPENNNKKQLLSVNDIMSFHRYYYQGTSFDLSTGVAAGPFGTPDRYSAGENEQQFRQNHHQYGAWERSIALFRTTYTTILHNDIVWLGPHAAHTTCFMPLPVAPLPPSLTHGDMTRLDKSTAFWTFRYVHTLTNMRYKDLHKKFIEPAQLYWENKAMKLLLLMAASKNHHHSFHIHVEEVLKAWWNMVDDIVISYADGFDYPTGNALGYPMDWLHEVNYQDGPPPPNNMGLIKVKVAASSLPSHYEEQTNKNLRTHEYISLSKQYQETM